MAPRVICCLWWFSCSAVVRRSSAVLQAWTWVGTAEDGRWDVPSSRRPPVAQTLGRSQPATPPPAPSTQRYLPLGRRWLVERSCSWGGRDRWNREERRAQRSPGAVRRRDVTRCFLDSRNQTQHGVSHNSKALQRKFRRYYFILGSFTSSHQSVGPYAPARKHASHLAVFIFIVIQQLQSMPGYLYHLPHKCHFSKRMVDTCGPRVQKSVYRGKTLSPTAK